MAHIDSIQLAVVLISIVLQIGTVFLARPLRYFMPKRLWLCFLWLNVAILARRFMSLADLHWHWSGEVRDSFEASIALSVSVLMMLCIVNLRKHLARQKQAAADLASAAVELAHKVKAEDSLAYRLAQVFIEQRSQRENDNNGVREVLR